MLLRLENMWRIALALIGGFALAVTSTAAIAYVFVAEGVASRGDAFYWSAYIGIVVYFLAMLWAFASNALRSVAWGFAALILGCGVVVAFYGGDASFGYGASLSKVILLLGMLTTMWVGFAALALSQNKHWASVVGERSCPSSTARFLKAVGWPALAVSVVLTLLRDGVSFGVILWPTLAFAVALAVSLAIAYRPHMLRRMARDVTYFTVPSPRSEDGDAA